MPDGCCGTAVVDLPNGWHGLYLLSSAGNTGFARSTSAAGAISVYSIFLLNFCSISSLSVSSTICCVLFVQTRSLLVQHRWPVQLDCCAVSPLGHLAHPSCRTITAATWFGRACVLMCLWAAEEFAVARFGPADGSLVPVLGSWPGALMRVCCLGLWLLAMPVWCLLGNGLVSRCHSTCVAPIALLAGGPAALQQLYWQSRLPACCLQSGRLGFAVLWGLFGRFSWARGGWAVGWRVLKDWTSSGACVANGGGWWKC